MPKKQKGFVHPSLLLIVLVLVSVAAVSVYLLMKPTQNNPQPTQVAQKQTPTLNLTVDEPQDQTLLDTGKVTVKGKTLPNTSVAIFDDNDAATVTSGADGNFTGDLNLDKGINTVTIQVFDDNGNDKTVTVNVVYDTAK